MKRTLNIKDSRHSHKKKHVSDAFIDVIYAYVKAIQSMPSDQNRPLKGGLDFALRLLTGSHATFVSESVLKRIESNKLNVNPFKLIWEDRNKMGKILLGQRNVSFAVWEHAHTIKDMRDQLIMLDTRETVAKIIYDYPGVAWISRKEDDELNTRGFSRTRPGGFLKCYKEAGITLLNEQMYDASGYKKN
jgi:hypothetical protein